jgi:hypothetical protein
MVAIAKNRRFAKIYLKIICSETAGPGPFDRGVSEIIFK